MATKAAHSNPIAKGAWKITWEGIGNADVGAAQGVSRLYTKSVQVLGTFGGATVVLQGSNDGGTTWAGLTYDGTNAISFTAAGLKQVWEHVEMIRPSSSGGTGSDIDVIVVGVEDV
jgi:hypothetical protein